MKAWGWILVPLLILAALIAAKEWGVREGRQRERSRVADSVIVVYRDTVRVRDSVLVVDSTRFRSYATRYYRLRDSLRTLNKDSAYEREPDHPLTSVPDSGAIVPVGGTVLALCDATIDAAKMALASCAARVRAGDSLLAATQARLKLEQRKPGPRLMAGFAELLWDVTQGEPVIAAGARFGRRFSLQGRAEWSRSDSLRLRAGMRAEF